VPAKRTRLLIVLATLAVALLLIAAFTRTSKPEPFDFLEEFKPHSELFERGRLIRTYWIEGNLKDMVAKAEPELTRQGYQKLITGKTTVDFLRRASGFTRGQPNAHVLISYPESKKLYIEVWVPAPSTWETINGFFGL
jgi:hypothetical protein